MRQLKNIVPIEPLKTDPDSSFAVNITYCILLTIPMSAVISGQSTFLVLFGVPPVTLDALPRHMIRNHPAAIRILPELTCHPLNARLPFQKFASTMSSFQEAKRRGENAVVFGGGVTAWGHMTGHPILMHQPPHFPTDRGYLSSKYYKRPSCY